MRLSEWRKKAPTKESLGNRVLAVLRPVLVDLGAEADAECWVLWGDDPELRYSVLAPTVAGLITVAVRPSGPEGPRATAKLIRWSKLSVSELGIEASGGHRMVAVQVESLVLKGMDDEADRICDFVLGLVAGIDGRGARPLPIAVVSGVAGMGRVPAVNAAEAGVTGRKPPSRKVSPKGVAAEPGRPPVPKPSGTTAPKAIAAGTKAAPKKAAKTAATALGSSLALLPAPAVPATPAAPPKPIAARTAAVQHGDRPGTGATGPAPEHSEPEPDRSEWIGPHPIEEPPAHERNRPRPWIP